MLNEIWCVPTSESGFSACKKELFLFFKGKKYCFQCSSYIEFKAKEFSLMWLWHHKVQIKYLCAPTSSCFIYKQVNAQPYLKQLWRLCMYVPVIPIPSWICVTQKGPFHNAQIIHPSLKLVGKAGSQPLEGVL